MTILNNYVLYSVTLTSYNTVLLLDPCRFIIIMLLVEG